MTFLTKINNKLDSKISMKHFIVFILIALSAYLRFYNLGYSDYIGDEHKSFVQPKNGQNYYEFFMSRRKGPMQFVFSHLTYLITGDYTNELLHRIPFAITSVLAVIIFYYLLIKLTKNSKVSFFATFLFLVNGFFVGFGRIAQYQNQNLLFSFLSLYFYSSFLTPTRHLKKDTILGTLFFSLSLLSHWDAIFILPFVIYMFIKYILNKKIDSTKKIKIAIINMIVGIVFILPFLIPYSIFQLNSPQNKGYFERRIGIGYSNNTRYIQLYELYNPFISLSFLIIGAIFSLLFIKKTYVYWIWFISNYLIFEFFVRKPGTHIYNFVIPLIILSSIGFVYVSKFLPKLVKVVYGVIILLLFVFLYYQSYFIFVDTKYGEYPWDIKTFYDYKKVQTYLYDKKSIKNSDRVYTKLETKKYTIEDKLPLFGFPHKRYWNEINDYINELNVLNDEKMGYYSNEVQTISEWYMDTKFQSTDSFYAIGVKKPLSFVNDWNLTNIKGKKLIKKFYRDGKTVVKIYKVE